MSVLDLKALESVPLVRDPFEYLVVRDFVSPVAIEAINRDFPEISEPRNFTPDHLEPGPAFESLLEELMRPELTERLGARFGVDLVGTPLTVTVRRHSQATDGNIHNDSWTKLVTALLYFHPEWPHPTGQLRFLRSADDIEDYAAEIPPVAGTFVAFRRSERSFHGFKPFVGERRMLQMSWVRPTRGARAALQMKRFSTALMKRLHLDRASNVKD
jgi:SM-20-related protein